MFLFGTLFSIANPPTPVPVPPSEVMFGQVLILKALAETTHGTYTGYGEGVKSATVANFDIPLAPVASTDELAKIIKTQNTDFVIKDPRERIWIESVLMNAKNETTFIGTGSFNMVVRRDEFGNETYVKPINAGYMYFQLLEQTINVEGALSAMALSVDGSSMELTVNNGVITIPTWVGSNPNFWNTLQVTFAGGLKVQYDKNGNLIREQGSSAKPSIVSFQGLTKEYVFDSSLETQVSPEYGWNPIIEFSVYSKQTVNIDIQSNYGDRPTFVRICTLEQVLSGNLPAPIQYDLEGDQYWTDQINVMLEEGNYFMMVEWPTWIRPEFGGGGKG